MSTIKVGFVEPGATLLAATKVIVRASALFLAVSAIGVQAADPNCVRFAAAWLTKNAGRDVSGLVGPAGLNYRNPEKWLGLAAGVSKSTIIAKPPTNSISVIVLDGDTTSTRNYLGKTYTKGAASTSHVMISTGSATPPVKVATTFDVRGIYHENWLGSDSTKLSWAGSSDGWLTTNVYNGSGFGKAYKVQGVIDIAALPRLRGK